MSKPRTENKEALWKNHDWKQIWATVGGADPQDAKAGGTGALPKGRRHSGVLTRLKGLGSPPREEWGFKGINPKKTEIPKLGGQRRKRKTASRGKTGQEQRADGHDWGRRHYSRNSRDFQKHTSSARMTVRFFLKKEEKVNTKTPPIWRKRHEHIPLKNFTFSEFTLHQALCGEGF